MRNHRNFLFGIAPTSSTSADLGRAALRVFTGLALAFGHGLGKLPPSEGFIEGVGEMGFPAPSLFAWLSAMAEFAGGLLLAVGLLTRPASLFVVVNMMVAAFLRHAGDPFGVREKALLFALIAFMYLLSGAGRYSIDGLVRRKWG